MLKKSTLAVAALVGLLASGGVWTASSLILDTPSSAPQQLFDRRSVVALAEAAASGRTSEVQRLLDAGVDVNSKGMRGLTPLGYALIRHNLAGAEMLLKRGADPNFTFEDDVYKTSLPFILIVGAKGSAEELSLLLKYGGNANARTPVRVDAMVDRQYEGDSLLISSVSDLVKVKALVQYGADVNYVPHPESTSVGGASAIVSAARLGELAVVNYLLDQGALDLDQTAHALQSRPWSDAKKAERVAVLRKLREMGGRIYASYRPLQSEKLEAYPPQDTPAEWISSGFLDMRQIRNAQMLRWEQQQRSLIKQ